MDGKQFEAAIGKWAKEAPEKMDAFARQVCQAIAERAMTTTPVGVTGFLRGSWQPSIGEPSTSHEGSADKGGAKVAAAIATVIPEIKAGVKFYMMNNAAYARRLEFGFVGEDKLGRKYNQAGRFWVTDAAKAWPQIARDVALELGMKA